MRYRFVLQLDKSPDDDLGCLTADEVLTSEVVVAADEEREPVLQQVFELLEAHLISRLNEKGTPHVGAQ